MKEKIGQFGFLKGVIILFLIGFLLGIGVFMGLREQLSPYTGSFYDTLIANLAACQIESGELLKKVLLKKYRSFFLAALFGISLLGLPYLIVFLIYKGFAGGFLLGSMLVKFGGRGLLLGLLYGFPQMLFYAPVMLAMLYKNYAIGGYGLKKKLLWEQLPSIGILAGILLLGCLSETYVNAWILKKLILWL